MSTNAIPVVDGKCSGSGVKPSTPPADAPTPTIGKDFSAATDFSVGAGTPGLCALLEKTGAAARGVFLPALPPVFLVILGACTHCRHVYDEPRTLQRFRVTPS